MIKAIQRAIAHTLRAMQCASSDPAAAAAYRDACAHLNAAKRNARLGEFEIVREHLNAAKAIIGVEISIRTMHTDIARIVGIAS